MTVVMVEMLMKVTTQGGEMLFFSAAITEFKSPSIMQENKRTCIYCGGLDTECCKYPLMLEEPSAVLQPKCNYCCAAHQHRFDGQKVFKEVLQEQSSLQSPRDVKSSRKGLAVHFHQEKDVRDHGKS